MSGFRHSRAFDRGFGTARFKITGEVFCELESLSKESLIAADDDDTEPCELCFVNAVDLTIAC